MEFIIDNLIRDSSQGSYFTILFDEKIRLEDALTNLTLACKKTSGNENARYGHHQGLSGTIYLSRGYLVVMNDILARGGYSTEPMHDTYRVRENNMDFHELEELVNELQH